MESETMMMELWMRVCESMLRLEQDKLGEEDVEEHEQVSPYSH